MDQRFWYNLGGFIRGYQEGGAVAPTPLTPGVQTGVPQGGHAAPAIQSYLTGGVPGVPGVPQLSYQPGVSGQDQQVEWLQQADAISQQLGNQSQNILAGAPAGGGGGTQPTTFQPGEVPTLGGGTIAYDSPHEAANAATIANTIEAGGINPATGQPNIVAGPNVLGAADEGFFGYGEDYNQEFQENYDDAYAHAEANPYGQTTGTPIYDQGYVPPGGLADTLVNNSLLGTIGGAITGENLVQTTDDLLPPAAAFNNDSGGNDNNNDGDPTNDTGNAGWGFTSVADLFDGGGPGQSGDSYSGGIHGDSTVGDTSEGVGSIFSGWGGGSDDDDGGSDDDGGGDGTWCCTAAFKHGMPIKKIKELRRWHKSRSQLWQDGYDSYGHWIANKLVKGSPFWSKVTEAGHTAFVERKLTPMSALAVLVIAPGSYAVGAYKLLTRRKSHANAS